jgi:hypothetical protein
MPFDQSAIVEVYPPDYSLPGQVAISWRSTAPDGWHQLYVDRKLTWWGRGASATIATPNGRSRIDLGAVGYDERSTDFSSSLPAPPSNRVALAWQGEDASAVEYRVYSSPSPGLPVSYATPVALIPAGVPGMVMPGFGNGGFGEGPYGGDGDASYRWTSGDLASGAWSFGVTAVDEAGNESMQVEASASIVAPPEPPARDSRGRRLTYTYDEPSRVVTLRWLPSPSA